MSWRKRHHWLGLAGKKTGKCGRLDVLHSKIHIVFYCPLSYQQQARGRFTNQEILFLYPVGCPMAFSKPKQVREVINVIVCIAGPRRSFYPLTHTVYYKMISTNGTVNVQNQGWTTKFSNTKTNSLSSMMPMHKNATAKNATVSSGISFTNQCQGQKQSHESNAGTCTYLCITQKNVGKQVSTPRPATTVRKYFRDALIGACVYTGVSKWHCLWIVEKIVMLPRKKKERQEKKNPIANTRLFHETFAVWHW